MKYSIIEHKFVDQIPETLTDGVLYVSPLHSTVVHKCFCGCGNEVVTPLSPTDWKIYFDGETISLDPSVGSWGLSCQSHYWITKNKVRWARKWSRDEINMARREQRLEKEVHYDSVSNKRQGTSWWSRLFN